MKRLSELARLIRSKNAGPFNQTLDILFEVPEYYRAVKEQQVITAGTVGALYGVDPAKVQIFCSDVAMAIKVAFPRPVSAGDIGNTDVFGAQQHAPLLGVEVDI